MYHSTDLRLVHRELRAHAIALIVLQAPDLYRARQALLQNIRAFTKTLSFKDRVLLRLYPNPELADQCLEHNQEERHNFAQALDELAPAFELLAETYRQESPTKAQLIFQGICDGLRNMATGFRADSVEEANAAILAALQRAEAAAEVVEWAPELDSDLPQVVTHRQDSRLEHLLR